MTPRSAYAVVDTHAESPPNVEELSGADSAQAAAAGAGVRKQLAAAAVARRVRDDTRCEGSDGGGPLMWQSTAGRVAGVACTAGLDAAAEGLAVGLVGCSEPPCGAQGPLAMCGRGVEGVDVSDYIRCEHERAWA